MRYEAYVLRASARGSRQTFAVYDNLRNQPVTKRRAEAPYTTTNKEKIDRLASRLNSANDAATVASALIDFGGSQSDAWHYAIVSLGS